MRKGVWGFWSSYPYFDLSERGWKILEIKEKDKEFRLKYLVCTRTVDTEVIFFFFSKTGFLFLVKNEPETTGH